LGCVLRDRTLQGMEVVCLTCDVSAGECGQWPPGYTGATGAADYRLRLRLTTSGPPASPHTVRPLQVCKAFTRQPFATPCGHLACVDCMAASSTHCPLPGCGAAYRMQPVDDPERAKVCAMSR
jgi:hypothetical protein